MKSERTKRTIFFGILCALLIAASSWYSILFDDSRFIAPMELSEYTFRVRDLPMILSGILLVLYILYLLASLIPMILGNRCRKATRQSTRTIHPGLGLLGFLGFIGFLGFWTYRMDKTFFPFLFFMFFGYFGFFYEGKMSNTFMDERYEKNKIKAHRIADKTAIAIIFLAVLFLGQGKLMGNSDYTLAALIIVISLSIALKIFLSTYLLYHYDHDEPLDESGE
ncbi:MAG: DUF3796 domain-containing protein [Eubacteriales bacterium]|nr:DUF3796 domain-containing protein [Eubacteriales bacterium]